MLAEELDISELLNLYDPYHEMDILQFVERMNVERARERY